MTSTKNYEHLLPANASIEITEYPEFTRVDAHYLVDRFDKAKGSALGTIERKLSRALIDSAKIDIIEATVKQIALRIERIREEYAEPARNH